MPIGHAGVVVAFVGETGVDTSGAEFTHGSIVSRGQKGVWATPLDPGRYPINTFTHKVEIVPTTNIVLNWATGKTESHKLDEKLSTIEVRSADGFAFNLDVSQIVHVSRENAPKVIARFGSMSNLVTQVLEPTIGNYFQKQRTAVRCDRFSQRPSPTAGGGGRAYPAGPGQIQRAGRRYADRRHPSAGSTDENADGSRGRRAVEGHLRHSAAGRGTAADSERAKSEADTRSQIVAASRAAEVAKLNADAAVDAARGEADAKKIIAEGQATYTKVTGEADASKTKMVGEAEAGVLKLKVESVGPQFYAAMNIFDRLAENKTALVPQIVAGVGTGEKAGGGSGSGIVDALLGVVLARRTSRPEFAACGGQGIDRYGSRFVQRRRNPRTRLRTPELNPGWRPLPRVVGRAPSMNRRGLPQPCRGPRRGIIFSPPQWPAQHRDTALKFDWGTTT